jgi:hypothetical protein
MPSLQPWQARVQRLAHHVLLPPLQPQLCPGEERVSRGVTLEGSDDESVRLQR